MPITYEEYKKKYKKQIQERKEQERQKRANQNKYQKINENQQKTVQNLRTKVVQEQDKQQLYKPVFTTQKDQIKYLTETAKERAKNPLPKQQEIKKFSVYNQELENKKKQIEEYEKTSDTYKKYKDEVNKGIYTKYLANQERVNNENVTTMDKLNVFRPLLVGLESGIDPGQYRLENGAIVDLPSYNELKQQKVQSEMGVIGQSIHGAVESIGHMAPAMLTSALPVVGPVAGVTTTFLTSFNSAQNQKLLEGYDIKEANAYATVNAGLEATLSKLMGGVSKIIGGKQTFLTKNLDKLTSKIIKNDGVRYFTSHLLAEEAEELTQMVLDPINEHITLGEYKNIGEALSTLNADETLITALSTLVTMGLTEGPSSVSVGKLSKTINQINKQYGTDFKLKTETNQIIDNKTNEDATNRFNELRKKSQISKVQEQQLIELETRAEQLESDRTNGVITEQEYSQEAQKISNEAKIFSEEQNNNKINPITEIEVEKENLNEQLNNNINKEQVKVIDNLVNKVNSLEKQVNKEEIKLPIAMNNIQKADNIRPNLSENQLEQLNKLDEKLKKLTQITKEKYLKDKNTRDKRIKGYAMEISAEKRKIIQGDWLIPVEGGLTKNELNNKISRLKSNYVGKKVIVNNNVGTIFANSYGKVGVEFENGSKTYFDKNKIIPFDDIDSIIQTQKNNYKNQINIASQELDNSSFNLKQTKGNIPINKELLNKYNNVTELISNNINNYDGKINVKNDIVELNNIEINSMTQNELSNIAIKIFKKYNNSDTFINDNNKIKVTNGGIKESINKILYNQNQKRYLKEHLQIYSDLGDIIESAILVSQTMEGKTRENNKIWNYYLNGLNINGVNYLFEFDVVSRQNGENHYRVQRLEKIEKEAGVSVGNAIYNSITPTLETPASYDNIIANNNENVKLPVISNNNMQINENNTTKLPKIANPLEISKLTKEEANTTPPLPKKTYKKGNEQSSFYKNITEKSEFLNKDFREMMKNEENIQYYQEITNENTLKEAYEKLQEGGMEETAKWFNKDVEKGNITAIDVAEGWILLKQYQDAGDYQSTVEVAKKMRNIGTKAGQTVQAFNIMNRLTPEGMVYYAQSELSEAYNIMVKNKTKKWIDQNASKFDLTTSEVQFIIDTMNEVKDMQDGYEKRVKLAEIQKVLTDKLPPERGAGIKSWMRISMLLNPKTQVRNVMGNAIIAPINTFSDLFASTADKIIAKKTGHRTTGNTNVKNYLKGFKEGAYQSYNDFKKGINTRNMQGNRFEVSEGKAFNNDTIIGKKLNQADNFLSFVLDAGDRTFYEATFTNSINNQLKLNNTTEVTPEMIDIATTEALQRTWQDNNEYTKAVLSIRKMLNKANVRGYGLGDVLIPFAKTPANLTKAIVDYSPVGLTKTLVSDAKQLKNSLENGQYNPQLQHRFVQNLGKGIAGSFLYIIGTALAKAGITTGENDEDKDVANFMRNSVGINSYSINIGNKSFSYDWAQPIAAPLAIMANYTKQSKENPEANIIERTLGVLDSGFDVLLAQSFLDTINEVLNGNGTPTERLQNAILDLPARAVPTFMKQIADMVDSTTRTSFEYDKPLKTAVNKVVAKVPVLSKTLEPSIDTLGNTTLKYGGKNNLFNVFINPANINKGKLTTAGAEIYRLYEETGDSTIMPRVAPYYINNKGEKIVLTNQQKTDFQKISGNIIEENVLSLLNDSNYQKMNDIDKASVVNELVNFSYNKARKEVLGLEMSQTYNRINKFMAVGGTPAQFYATKDKIDSFAGKNKKQKIINYIESQPMTIEQKAQLIKMKYPSFETYDTNIINYINKQSLSISEKTELLELLGFEVRNGKVYK